MNKWMRVIKRILFFITVCCFLFFIWKVNVSDGIRPAEQRTEDGWFQGINNPIRSIRLCVETQYRDIVLETPKFTVWITDESGTKIWEKTYYGLSMEEGEMQILEEFKRGEGIEIGEGKYQIHDTISRSSDIRISYKILTYDGNYRSFYFTCTTIALVILTVFLVITMRRQGKYGVAVNYFLALIFMGILFSVIMPPLTVPDEESHFRKAYDLSSQMTFQSRETMRKTDNDSIIYLHNAASIERWYADFNEKADLSETVNTKWSSVPDTTPFYAYLFPAIGISAGRLLGLNGHWVILLGRLFNLLGVAVILAVALQLIPFGKKYFSVLLLLPEVVYLTASYSYDALNLALCFLSAAYFFYMISDEKPVRLKNIIIFIGIVLIMIPIKLVYAPLLGLILLIPRKQLQMNRKIIIRVATVGILGILAFLYWRWEDIVVLLRGLDYNTEEETRVSIKYILQYPKSTIFVFIRNLMYNFDYYMKSILGEFVGIDRYEALLDRVYLPEWMMTLISVMLVMGIYTDNKSHLCLCKKIWLLFLGTGSCLLIFLSMYLANNTISMNDIHGVQGRYFLPVLLLFPAIAGKKRNDTGSDGRGLSENAYLISMMGIDMIAIFTVLEHYAIYYYG